MLRKARYSLGVRVFSVCLGLALLGCGGGGDDDDDDDDDDSDAVAADFVGTWLARSNAGTNSCSGDFDVQDVSFTIDLRLGSFSDLELVEHSAEDPSVVTCTEFFSMSAGVATLEGEQTCEYMATSTDTETGETTTFTDRVTYTADRLELSGKDSLRERGMSHSDLTGERCEQTFRIAYDRR